MKELEEKLAQNKLIISFLAKIRFLSARYRQRQPSEHRTLYVNVFISSLYALSVDE